MAKNRYIVVRTNTSSTQKKCLPSRDRTRDLSIANDRDEVEQLQSNALPAELRRAFCGTMSRSFDRLS